MGCKWLKEDIWKCSLRPEDVYVLRCKSQFWLDVMASWSEWNYFTNRRLENQLIWYNNEIKIQQKPFFWKDAYSKGLKYIHQLFMDGDFKTDEQVRLEFGLTQLRYNSLKTAMPIDYKTFFQQTPAMSYLPTLPHNYDLCRAGVIKNLSRKVYEFLGDDVLLIHHKYVKWGQELGRDFCEGLVDFGKIHGELYQLTNVPKLRSFQYRLLQRSLVTNVLLHKWNLHPTGLCTFCSLQKETAAHLLVECVKVYPVWVKLVEYVTKRFGVQHVSIDSVSVILNRIVKPKYHVVNLVCLLFKQFIYRQRCLKKELVFQHFVSYLCTIENIEKYIAEKNGKQVIHEKKWSSGSHIVM